MRLNSRASALTHYYLYQALQFTEHPLRSQGHHCQLQGDPFD